MTLLNMRTGGGVHSFLRLDFIFRVEAPFFVLLFFISLWGCKADPPAQRGHVSLAAEEI